MHDAVHGLSILPEAQSIATNYFGANGPPALLSGLARAKALVLVGSLAEADHALADVTPGLERHGIASAENGALLLVRARLALLHDDRVNATAILGKRTMFSRRSALQERAISVLSRCSGEILPGGHKRQLTFQIKRSSPERMAVFGMLDTPAESRNRARYRRIAHEIVR